MRLQLYATMLGAALLFNAGAVHVEAQPQPGSPDLSATSLKYLLANPPQPVELATISASRLDNPGACSYFYWVVANFPIGNAQPAGPAAITNGACTLASGNVINWGAVAGAVSYDVLMTSTAAIPTDACGCAVATGVTALTATDTGTLGAYTVSTFTGNMVFLSQNTQCSANLSGLAFTPQGSGAPAFTITSDGVLHAGGCTGTPITGQVNFPLLAPDGSNSAPQYSFASHPQDGMFWSNAIGGGNQGLCWSVFTGFSPSTAFCVDQTGEIHVLGGIQDNVGGSGTINVQQWNFGPQDLIPFGSGSHNLGSQTNRIGALWGGSGVMLLARKVLTSQAQLPRDFGLLCDPTGGAVTYQLNSSPNDGQLLYIKKISTTPNACVIDGNGNNIDGSSTLTLSGTSQSVLIQFSTVDSQWNVVGSNIGASPLAGTGLQTAQRTVTSNTTLTADDFAVFCDATAGTVTLTAPASPQDGTVFFVKKIDSSTNACQFTGSSNVDGSASYNLDQQNQSAGLEFSASPAQWYVIAQQSPTSKQTLTGNTCTTSAVLNNACATTVTVSFPDANYHVLCNLESIVSGGAAVITGTGSRTNTTFVLEIQNLGANAAATQYSYECAAWEN